jgi:lysophospholipase L1-like esterase
MRRWNATFERNKQLAGQFFDDDDEFDVVFFGDSITEHWEGTELGTPAWEGVNLVFREEFTRIGGGRLDGLALGIAGDRVRTRIKVYDVLMFWLVMCFL